MPRPLLLPLAAWVTLAGGARSLGQMRSPGGHPLYSQKFSGGRGVRDRSLAGTRDGWLLCHQLRLLPT